MHTTLPLLLLAASTLAAAPHARTITGKQVFPPLVYDTVQISCVSLPFAPAHSTSDGLGGTALEQATKLCVTPFAGLQLSAVTAQDHARLDAFRLSAEAAETSRFNPQIHAAGSSALGKALTVGKTKNKVLKLLCEVQSIKISTAQGKNETLALAVETKKINKNVALDAKNAGAKSQGVAKVVVQPAPAAASSAAVSSATSVRHKNHHAHGKKTASASIVGPAPTSSVAEPSTSVKPRHGKHGAGKTSVVASVSSTSSTFVKKPKPIPAPVTPSKNLLTVQSYNAFQISGASAGDALAHSAALCVTPFANVDLKTVSKVDLANLNLMWEAAQAAETQVFTPAIAAAKGAMLSALKHGQIQNKVLKLVCFLEVLKIKEAQGLEADATAKIAKELGKLEKNVRLDVGARGQASQGVSFVGHA